jgi:hypothetical protein
MVEAGAYPSPLNYFNFPKSVCTSVNEVRQQCLPLQPASRLSISRRLQQLQALVVLQRSPGWAHGICGLHVPVCAHALATPAAATW